MTNIPLIDSGLYGPIHGNNLPPDLLQRGLATAPLITKRLPDGTPGTGKAAKCVILALGMSNWRQELQTFLRLLRLKPPDGFGGSKYPTYHIGARGAWDARRYFEHWPEYESWLLTGLAKRNITLAQVQVLLLKNSIARQSVPVEKLADYHEFVVNQLARLCPNLQQVYVTSAGYSGFGVPSAPRLEPWAWEEGKIVQEWILDRAEQAAEPWTAFGPYFWADGINKRDFDGLFYVPADFESHDGVHPGPGAEAKIAKQIWDFFSKPQRSPAAGWFRK